MSIRISRDFLLSRIGLALVGTIAFLFLTVVGVSTYYWVSYGRMIDQRLGGHVQQTTARIYAAPMRISTGQTLSVGDLANHLQRAGYSELDAPGTPGRYILHGNEIEIRPSSESYFTGRNRLVVDFTGNHIQKIRTMDTGAAIDSVEVEPELLTSLFDESREKRRAMGFNDIPKVLRDAVLSVEDRRFFEHPGFDAIRILGAAWADLRHGARVQGGSTISMQVARSFFFNSDRTWRRKVAETVVALELEHRFTKAQIFELYANEIYLGNRGSFAIHGFGEASLAYFNKDVRGISLPEAAFLAGIIHAPNRYSTADRRPERAVEARDRALLAMTENGMISAEQARDAKKVPLISSEADSREAPRRISWTWSRNTCSTAFRKPICSPRVSAFTQRSIRIFNAQPRKRWTSG